MSFVSKFKWFAGVAVASLAFASPAQAEPPLWVVKDKDSTVYLFGTVHVLKPDMQWNTPAIQAAVKESAELWLEILDGDNEAVAGPIIQKYGIDLAKPLSKKLTPEQLAKVNEVGQAYGMPAAALEAMQPWLVGVTFSLMPLQKAGFDPKLGVEAVLKSAAQKDGDKLNQLETLEKQIGFFASLSEAQQVEFLMQAVEDASEGPAMIEKLAAAWQKGDVATLEQILVLEMKAESPQLYDLMFTKRNADWAGQIETILKGSGTQMIAVGAGHLIGPDSVQAQLGSRGIVATRLK